jgi:hypothetical protein
MRPLAERSPELAFRTGSYDAVLQLYLEYVEVT